MMAALLTSGCGKKTTIINNPPPPPPTDLPRPDGDTSREEAEFMLQEAYERGRRVGRQSVLAELSEEEREERREARQRRRDNWMLRRRQLHREILIDTLADRYDQQFEELLEVYNQNNPEEELACSAQVEEEPVEVDTPPPEDEPGGGDEPEEVSPSADNLDCWSRLCPSVASVITDEPDLEPRRRKGPRARRGPAGWIGYATGEDVDLDEIGVELPAGDPISSEDLDPLLDEAFPGRGDRGVRRGRPGRRPRVRGRRRELRRRRGPPGGGRVPPGPRPGAPPSAPTAGHPPPPPRGG
jgi:hypothetical protein